MSQASKSTAQEGDEAQPGVSLPCPVGKNNYVFHSGPGRVAALRHSSAKAIVQLMAWCALCADAEHFKDLQRKHVEEGIDTILQVQRYRNSFLDVYFSAWTFAGEELFYLIACPILIWHLDLRFGCLFTLVVCTGNYSGNLLKDMFCLPRPKWLNNKVWVPTSLSKSDSTLLNDYGFPSTHAMNSISNPLFCLCFYWRCCYRGMWPRWGTPGVLLCLLWTASMATSRLYLGVHTMPDVLAGARLGLVVCLFWVYQIPHLEPFIAQYSPAQLLLGSVLAGIFLLELCPVPPSNRTSVKALPGATFKMQGEMLGLIMGIFPAYALRQLHPISPTPAATWPLLAGFCGFFARLLIVVLTRAVMKEIAKLLLLRGLDRPTRAKLVLIPLRGRLRGVACAFVVYYSISVSVVYLAPALCAYLGV